MYFRPRTLDETIDTLSRHGGQILSGGTDFFPALGDRPIASAIVDISGVAELRGISFSDREIRIGGLTTWTEELPGRSDRFRSRIVEPLPAICATHLRRPMESRPCWHSMLKSSSHRKLEREDFHWQSFSSETGRRSVAPMKFCRPLLCLANSIGPAQRS